ncbi:fimbrial biogenesis outer membrane usher protein [Acinetobacter sp. 187]|uniref:fimbria/pilus outer membrane usher protein n=1 Tax=Acinetobacter lanii TaxID=2715163 RepID=UPI001408861F|nr:fimbria/pilus outer membrane usher protein [Acinetobacter lanii]NHC03428.1 fimbrial biogenesis outer membrane usher protein [Acinetobacter lanii]
MKKKGLTIWSLFFCTTVVYGADVDTIVNTPSNQAPLEHFQATDQRVENATSFNKTYIFDSRSFFGSNGSSGELIKIAKWNVIPEGKYSLRTSVNNRRIGELLVEFKHLDASSNAVLCVDKKILLLFDLKKEVLEKLPLKQCLTIKEISPEAYYDYDQSTLSLNISLPLVVTENRPRGYISPDFFDKGVNSAFLSYQYSSSINKSQDYDNISNTYLNLNSGINFFGWNYRNSGYFDSEDSKLKKIQMNNHVLSTDILKLKSRFYIGEFNTQPYATDSANIRGVQLASDISMLPSSQQYYSPLIEGIAHTNAVVSVFQNGQKIFEKNVPAGPFELNDLSASSGYGDLTVIVTEQGGEKKSFNIPLQGNMNLIRVGQLNYHAALGRYRFSEVVSNEHIGQLSFQYGMTNFLTMYAGASYGRPYQNYSIGSGINSYVGAFRIEADHAEAQIKQDNMTGQKYKIFYQYKYLPLNTFFNTHYQFQTQDYVNLANAYSQLEYRNLNLNELNNLKINSKLKNQYSFSVNQPFKKSKYGSIHFNFSNNQYWNDKEDYGYWSLNYSNNWQRIYYSLSMTKNTNITNNINQGTYYQMSLSLPLSIARKSVNINSTMSYNDDIAQAKSASVGFSGVVGENYQLSYSLANQNIWTNQKNSSSLTSGLNYNFSQLKLGLTSSINDQNQQFGANLSGGIVAHRHGLTLSNNLTDTFTIIHAKDAQGAKVNNSFGGKIDWLGNAIYSNVSPYVENSIALDIRDLPTNINLKANESKVIPRRFSSTLIKFDTEDASNIILNLHLKNGEKIPMGTSVKDSKSNIIGYFGQSNQLFINDFKKLKDRENIFWGQQNRCELDLSKNIFDEKKHNKNFHIIDVECLP